MPAQEKGLTSKEAEEKLTQFGKNLLPEKPPPSDFKLLASQLKSPLVYVLMGAGLVTLALRHVADTILIFGDVVLNTILGFIQERKADRSLTALKKLVHPQAKVLRDGKQKVIKASLVVPEDIAILKAGDKVPGDGELVFANRLFINEAILTGESLPVGKEEGDEVFMGTIITSGQGRVKVKTIGKDTKIGAIALSVQEGKEDTPLRRQLVSFSKQLSILVGILVLVVFVIGLLVGKPVTEILTTSVALAVSTIPEGLLVALTVVLAIGMQRILKRKGLVRSLLSAETLGGVTTICIDKTGTLTKGEMQVVDVIGEEKTIAKQMILANDLDEPIVIAGYDWARNLIEKPQRLVAKNERLDSLPFSSKDKYFASLHLGKQRNTLYVNGAPEVLLKKANLSENQKKQVEKEIETLTKEGKRVIGLVKKEFSIKKKEIEKRDIDSLEWVGLLAFSDPIRVGVREAFEKTKRAGLETLVVTGDYPQTALKVMKQLNFDISENQILLGKDLEKLSKEKLSKKIKSGVKLFARTTPDQKLRIVEALKDNQHVVAMMGDGVNDAPALKHADIGIVVGEASDVAKESSDLVLMDSSFATIVASIEEGRGIFDNIRKIVLYLLSDAFEEILAVVGSIILGLPLAVTAAQILWINLVSDGFPDLALTVDPKAKDIMSRKPRSPQEKIVTNWMKLLIVVVSTIGGIVALSLFAYYYSVTSDVAIARSVAFASLGANSLVFVYSTRTLTNPFWKVNLFANKWLNLAVVGGLILQFIPFAIPGLGKFLSVKFPGFMPLVFVFLGSIFTFIMIEVLKSVIRKRISWFQH